MGRWIRAPLGELTSKIGSGATPLGGEAAYRADGISLIRSLNVHDGEFRHQDLAFLSQEQADGLANVVVQPNDVLLNITGASVARCCTVPDEVLPARVNQHVAIIRPHPDRISARFLQYLLVSSEYKDHLLSAGEGAGATRQALTKGQLQSFLVEFPESLDEQSRIVAILDEAFAGIATAKANAEKNLQNARELFATHHQAVFSRMGASVASACLGNIASFRNGINYTRQSKGRTVRIIGVKDFQNHFWAPLDDLDAVTLDGDLSAADAVAEGDILTVRSNGNPELIGRCMVVGELTEPVTHSGFTIRIAVDRSIVLPAFVCQFMKSRAIRRKLIDGGNGLNIRSLNQGMLSEIVVPLPTLPKQREVVADIEAMTLETARLSEVASCKLAALDELKKSLLHQAFTGAL